MIAWTVLALEPLQHWYWMASGLQRFRLTLRKTSPIPFFLVLLFSVKGNQPLSLGASRSISSRSLGDLPRIVSEFKSEPECFPGAEKPARARAWGFRW